MVSASSMIPTRSPEQAKEWSLVLLSQGIESAIEPSGEDGKWLIEVEAAHFTRAVRILRQYTTENKKVPRPETPSPEFVFHWGNTWFFVLLITLFTFGETMLPNLRGFGVMDRNAFLTGDWWRPFTAVLLHNDPAHLAANVVIGMVFLALAGGIFGAGRALVISYAAGVIANLAHCLIPLQFASLGASGMVMGALGLITAHSVVHKESTADRGKVAVRGLCAGVLLLVLLGFNPHPQTDVLAHIVGFLAGFILGAAGLAASRLQTQNSRLGN